MAYVLFIIFKLIELVAFFLGHVFFLPAYLARGIMERYSAFFKIFILYWFVNSDEEKYVDNWYGVYELVQDDNGQPDYDRFNTFSAWRKFWLSYWWVCWRNPHWNLKLLMGRVAKGTLDKDSVKIKGKLIGDKPAIIWRNKTIHGRQSIRYRLEEKALRFFRYSFTRPLKKWSPFRLLRFNMVNVMAGFDNWSGRIVLKWRVWRLLD